MLLKYAAAFTENYGEVLINKSTTIKAKQKLTLETRSGTLMADDWVLDEARLPPVGGNHHGLGCLRLDGEGRLGVGLNQGLNREAMGLQ